MQSLARKLSQARDSIDYLIENSLDSVLICDGEGNISKTNRAFLEMLGYTAEEVQGRHIARFAPVETGRYESVTGDFVEIDEGFFEDARSRIYDLFEEGKIATWKTYLLHKNQRIVPVEENVVLFYDSSGEPVEAFGIIREISERKQMEAAFLRIKTALEEKLEERTMELEEAHTALRVLLKQRSGDRALFEQKIVSNFHELVLPYVEKLKETELDPVQRVYLGLVETNLADIVSPFVQKIQVQFRNLTPMEIQVANMVKQGQTTKETAEVLNLSAKTVETHRRNIRKKLGINNKKTNLRSFLLTAERS